MSNSAYDLIIVGCGFTGGTIAHLAARRLGCHVLVLERRGHIAGNMYDEKDSETGILVQKYGSHAFHTDTRRVFEFIHELGEWEPFVPRTRVQIFDRLTPSPFNFQTIDEFFTPVKALQIKTRMVETFSYRPKVTILEMLKSEDPVVREYAEFLFRQDYQPYTSKQWGISPEQLDVSVLQRVPVRLSYVDQYFDDRYQMQPKGGYTSLFKKMLSDSKIELQLSTDACTRLALEADGAILLDGRKVDIPVVYTGALDELFQCKYGRLPYRSLSFQYHLLAKKEFQPTSCVVYPFAEGYTRVIEFSKLMPLPPDTDKTIIAYEYPEEYGTGKGKEAYYPILTSASQTLYQRYKDETKKYHLLYPCGRLGDFQYYNMDQAILRAMDMFETLPLRR